VLERRRNHLHSAFATSFACHLVAIASVLLAIRTGARSPAEAPRAGLLTHVSLAWPIDSRPAGGGGGGGDGTNAPPRRVQMAETGTRTVPAARPPQLDALSETPREPGPVAQLTIPVEPIASGAFVTTGTMEVVPSMSVSLGPGSGGGAGAGRPKGDGPGDGSGLGPGRGGNFGDNLYGPGTDVATPRLVREVRPQYTADAMSARIQGTVRLECLVQSDGSVGSVRVLRSLDSAFGLDREAMNAARQWRFVPATRRGRPVDVLVTIELTFTLR
jgi:periplasmic protein TonB